MIHILNEQNQTILTQSANEDFFYSKYPKEGKQFMIIIEEGRHIHKHRQIIIFGIGVKIHRVEYFDGDDDQEASLN